jgi:hypothetical protein
MVRSVQRGLSRGAVSLKRGDRNGMLKRLLIGLMVITFVLIGIHLSWGASHRKCVEPTLSISSGHPGQ